MKKDVELRASEANIGAYLGRIASGIIPGVGAERYSFKLDKEGFRDGVFKTPDGEKLMNGAEKMVSKMEVLSRHAVNIKKFKIVTKDRLNILEEL